MSKGKTREIIDLLDSGYALYSGEVPEDFYFERRCPSPKKAEWFVRPWSKEHAKSRYICLGCSRRCSVVDPEGWQLLLPVNKRLPAMVAFAPARELSAEDLLRLKKVLRTDEAAFVLNISAKTVYDMVNDGRLDAVEGHPVRVTVESVIRCLEPVVP